MTTTTLAVSGSNTCLRPILLSAMFGAALVFIAGFSNPNALHAATHDTRHATGFPCH